MSKCVCKCLECGEEIFLDDLPPVSFKHIDVSVLLEKMQQINTDIDYLKRTMGTQVAACEMLREVSEKLDDRLTAVEGHCEPDAICLTAVETQLGLVPSVSGLSSAVLERPIGPGPVFCPPLRLMDVCQRRMGSYKHAPTLKLKHSLRDHSCSSLCRLINCSIGEEGCAALISALRSNPSHLTELNLRGNIPGDSGVKLLSALLEDPHCKLEKLWLRSCSIGEEGCAALISALRSNPSHLTELDLSRNTPGDLGVKLLSALLEDPHCKLEKLWLYNCSIGEEGCAALISALRSNPSHPTELNLRGNEPGDSGVKMRSALLEDPHCKLKKLLI
ncbi:ribonuclease inhibitor-like [Carassius auratus]|uniref:Ribonuclease inhibitor-like n=1 Tax=Carassius auratus TaxID=7957 RepID=A0A6P6P370_CARAU|nr:ribonuclease inhibitor-like [Carassius auratus]